MCEKEQVHDIGETLEEMTERMVIYEHHQPVEVVLVVSTAVVVGDADDTVDCWPRS